MYTVFLCSLYCKYLGIDWSTGASAVHVGRFGCVLTGLRGGLDRMNSRITSWALFFNRGGMSPLTWNATRVHRHKFIQSMLLYWTTLLCVCFGWRGHRPWLCAVCSAWPWCRPWASRRGWAGTRWAEGCTGAPVPSSAWPLHAGPSSPEPSIEPGRPVEGQHEKGGMRKCQTALVPTQQHPFSIPTVTATEFLFVSIKNK